MQVCLSMYDLLLPPLMKVLSEIIFLKKTRAHVTLKVFLICAECELGIMLVLWSFCKVWIGKLSLCFCYDPHRKHLHLSIQPGVGVGGCHCCQYSTPKWLTLISRVQSSFLKKLWTRFLNLTKSRCERHCSERDAYIGWRIQFFLSRFKHNSRFRAMY